VLQSTQELGSLENTQDKEKIERTVGSSASTTIAPRYGVVVGQRLVIDAAGSSWVRAREESCFAWPCAGRLAAIPVTGCCARSRCLGIGLDEEGEEGEEGLG
jgi:hypothetical protein